MSENTKLKLVNNKIDTEFIFQKFKYLLEIEKIAFQKRVTHLEAISIYCEQMGIEPVTTAKLLTKSFTHKSFNPIENNEKLEFLGDRVLGLIISKNFLIF